MEFHRRFIGKRVLSGEISSHPAPTSARDDAGPSADRRANSRRVHVLTGGMQESTRKSGQASDRWNKNRGPGKKGSARSFDGAGKEGSAKTPRVVRNKREIRTEEIRRITDQKWMLRALLLVSAPSCCQSHKPCPKQQEARRLRRDNRLLINRKRKDGMKFRNRRFISP
jgi:hypothetical protein